ncbi:hypothetical protein [Blastococcus sp. TF02A-30]|uniref:hypothetical protein n=1 Tax=Blastococcus sp. TF02A-30 TaxID=2250580 RepID=UPI001314EC23|nr:hypothetical protein [Blastococcus sp. TF02A-30]
MPGSIEHGPDRTWEQRVEVEIPREATQGAPEHCADLSRRDPVCLGDRLLNAQSLAPGSFLAASVTRSISMTTEVAVSAASSSGAGAVLVTGEDDGVSDDEGVVALGEESGLASLAAQPASGSSDRSTPTVNRRVVIATVLAGAAGHASA